MPNTQNQANNVQIGTVYVGERPRKANLLGDKQRLNARNNCEV